MEAYLKSVWDDVYNGIKDSIEEPESRAALKDIIHKAMIKNKAKLPSVEPSGEDHAKFVNKHATAVKGKTASGYNLHWKDWTEENTQKEYPDPEDPAKTLSAHKYWQKHVWPNLSKADKDKYNNKAKLMRNEAKKVEDKTGETGTSSKKKVTKSGYQLFLEKMKDMMGKDEEFTHPESGDTVKLHRYLIYVWNTHIKNDDDLKEPYESLAKSIRDSDDGAYDLSDLPHLDVEKLRSGELDNLELIED